MLLPPIHRKKSKQKRKNKQRSLSESNLQRSPSQILKDMGLSKEILQTMSMDEWKLFIDVAMKQGMSLPYILSLRHDIYTAYDQTPIKGLVPNDKVDHYMIEKFVGNGSFGQTFLVSETDTTKHPGEYKILKQIKCNGDRHLLRSARKEAIILAHAPQSKHLITIFDFFEWKGDYCIITNYCPGGTLHDRIIKQPKSVDIIHIFKDCIKGLHALHSHHPPIVHRDLKPDNIFYDTYNNVILGDLGLARLVDKHTNHYHSRIGYISYKSPETISHNTYSTSSDIWHLGCVLVTVLTMNASLLERCMEQSGRPIGTFTHTEIQKWFHTLKKPVMSGEKDGKKRTYIGSDINDIILSCLHTIPRERPTAKNLYDAYIVLN